MATHDYVIDNSTGANVRADINNVLQAILSNNSNSSAPSTTAAYMWWADTTNGVLKIRNSANNAWVELFQLDGTLTLEDGSASTPALAFRDDLNTGIFSSAADNFSVATGGVERMSLGATTIFNESGADVDFRIEGDTEPNLFYVDAGNDRIGIGLSSPSSFLHTKVTGADNQLRIETATSGNPEIMFNASGAGGHVIGFDRGNAALTFTVAGGSQRMQIDSSGRLLVGKTASKGSDGENVAKAQIESTGNCMLDIAANGTTTSSYAGLNLIRSDGSSVNDHTAVDSGDRIGKINFIGADGSDRFNSCASIRAFAAADFSANNCPGYLTFNTNSGGASASERLRILKDGGITFNGDTAAANALSDYEQGTWSPVFIPTSGTFATYVASTSAFYIKVGRLVNVWCQIHVTSLDITGGSSSIRINGLPYTAATGNGIDGGTMNVNYYTNFQSMGDQVPSGYVANNTNFIVMIKIGGNAQTAFTVGNLGTTNFYMHMSYYANQ